MRDEAQRQRGSWPLQTRVRPLWLCSTVLIALAFLSMSKLSHARQAISCAAHDDIAKHLGAKFAEDPVSLGLAGDGKLLEVFATKDGSTWTIVVTAPSGISCIVAAGRHWQDLPVKPDGPDV